MKTFIDFLRRIGILPKQKYLWVVEDPRPAEAVKRDYAHEERELTAGAADPFNHTPITSSPYPEEDQQGVGSCVPHGVGLALAIVREQITRTYFRLAWTFIYRLRSNYPAVGCWLQDIFDKYRSGVPLYNTLPDPATERQATNVVITEAMRTEAEIFKGLEYYTMSWVSYSSIDEIAKVAAGGIPVPIVFYSTYNEWARSIPQILDPYLQPGNAEVRHCVTVLPYSGHYRSGKKFVTIQDSSHFGGLTLRHVSEEFIKQRVYGAGYWISVKLLGSGTAPKYRFTQTLRYGMKGEDVRNMQLLFISLGLLPNDCATGLFAGRTLAAVHAFQTMFADEILKPQGLALPTDTFGAGSMKKANELCS